MNDVATTPPRTAQAYKSTYKPIWCPGCGDYSVLSSVTKALAKLDLPGRARSFHRPGPLPLRPGELADAILAWSSR